MPHFADMVFEHGGVPVSNMGIPPGGTWYFVDTENGNDSNDGRTVATALASVTEAEDKCTASKNDVVAMIMRNTADAPTATITWDKDYTHLIGLSQNVPGINQRCRISGTAANAITPVLTVSARGCIMRNFQVQNSKGAVCGGVLVSGPYNYFENVYFNGMNASGGATAAGSYCLSVSGAENFFRNCTIGSCQTVRTSTNGALLISNGSNRWVHCEIQGYSETAGNFLVKVDATSGLGDLIFEDCLFYCQTVNWAAACNHAFGMSGGSSHYVILRGNCMFVGVSMGVADTVTHVYTCGPTPNGGAGVATTVTT